jgi:hypothetical protein
LGADRRGPLAAFVIVAVIAAILLITSVRSQAAPWFSARIVAGPATEPHLWGSVTGGMHQVVREGAVLVRKAAQTPADDPTRTETLSTPSSVVTPRHQGATTTRETRRTPSAHKTTHHRPANAGTTDETTDGPGVAPTAPSTPATPGPGSAPGNPGQGLHLGWYQHHGQDQSENPPDSGERPDPADEGAEHGNGHGHAYGYGQRHGHGHGNDRH